MNSTKLIIAWGTGISKTPIPILSNLLQGQLIKIAIGRSHCLFLAENDKKQQEIYGFGRSKEGQLGSEIEENYVYHFEANSVFEKRRHFLRNLEQIKIENIIAGPYHSSLICEGGNLIEFGYTPWTNAKIRKIEGLRGFFEHSFVSSKSTVSSGNHFNMFIDSEGRILSWGENSIYQLGRNGQTSEPDEITVKIPHSKHNEHFVEVSSGSYHTLAITNQGRLFGWGNNIHKQLGSASEEFIKTPTEIPIVINGTERKAVRISCGSCHSTILLNDNTVVTMGSGRDGHLGLGRAQSNDSGIPATVNLDRKSKIVSLGGGVNHTVILTEHGIYGWGWDQHGALSLSNTDDDKVIWEPQKILSRQLRLPGKGRELICTDVIGGMDWSFAIYDERKL